MSLPLEKCSDLVGRSGAKQIAPVHNHHFGSKGKGFLQTMFRKQDRSAQFPIDLQLSGHTHGGQVTLFGWIVPETGSKYGRRFLSGLNYNNQGIPVITSNGLGTSRKNIRTGARSDIIIVTLIREDSSSQKGNGK